MSGTLWFDRNPNNGDMSDAEFNLREDVLVCKEQIAELKRRDKAHKQVAANIQDTLDKGSKQHRTRIAELEAVILNTANTLDEYYIPDGLVELEGLLRKALEVE